MGEPPQGKNPYAAVATSRKWDAGEAGREIGEQLAAKTDKKPKFVLLFSTIHYEKRGGFQEFLDNVNSRLPEGTPVVGGTIAGFMNKTGCYTRGASALAVYSDEMEVAVGIGHDTKKNPKKAAEECAQTIKKKLAGTRYANKYFVSFVSSSIVPSLPVFGNKKIVKKFFLLDLFLSVFDVVSQYAQVGVGRDEKVMECFSNALPGFSGIGGGSCDDLKLERNYQFFGKTVATNSVVSLAFTTNQEVAVSSKLSLYSTGKKLTITDTSRSGYIVKQINGQPALDAYLKLMNWNKNVLDERLYRKVFYYPLVQTTGQTKEPRLFGLVYGDSFVFPMKPDKNTEMDVCSFSGSSMIASAAALVEKEKYNSGVLISCGTRLETLGSKVYRIKEGVFDKKFAGDYLLIYTAGEYKKEPGSRMACLYQSDNALLF